MGWSVEASPLAIILISRARLWIFFQRRTSIPRIGINGFALLNHSAGASCEELAPTGAFRGSNGGSAAAIGNPAKWLKRLALVNCVLLRSQFQDDA
jgi:hypothetical protein